MLHDSLEQLSQQLALTVEWYQPEGDALVIRWQVNTPRAAVQVRAQLGFTRDANGEIDAVAQLVAHSAVVLPGLQFGATNKANKSNSPLANVML